MKINENQGFKNILGDADDGELSDGLCEGTELDQSLYWMQRLNVIGEELEMLRMLDDDDVSFSGKFSE